MGDSSDYYYILEREIRRAMANTFSNRQAAKCLGISVKTYKRAASQYIDQETGKTLYELHKNEAGKGMKKPVRDYPIETIEKIFNGEITKVYTKKFVRACILNLIFEEKCALCGFDERKPDTFEAPLVLEFIDGNRFNFKRENLRLICLNCCALKGKKIIVRSPSLANYTQKDEKERYYMFKNQQVANTSG